jgi:uncharacterized protein (DUF1330 family)
MPAYVIAQIEVDDAAQFEEYRRQVPATIAAYGGRYIVRGGECETLEGTWAPKRVVILEFPDRTQARAWWASEAYAPARALRERAARTQLIVIDGV